MLHVEKYQIISAADLEVAKKNAFALNACKSQNDELRSEMHRIKYMYFCIGFLAMSLLVVIKEIVF